MFIWPKLKNMLNYKTKHWGLERKLSSLKALAGDLSSVPTPKSGSSQLPEVQFQESDTTFWPPRALYECLAHMDKHATHTQKIN